ncbi:uncharacterized protein LOC143214913 [Lasioglossum baleicum]|uniref:uncharacterized protein LOC143214913 n=1 Tax=Lasioglossum baleicum TaxID=434251 RepID=UPI003FCD54EF
MPTCDIRCPIVRAELKKVVARAPWIWHEQVASRNGVDQTGDWDLDRDDQREQRAVIDGVSAKPLIYKEREKGKGARQVSDSRPESSRRFPDTNGDSSRRLPDTNGESSRRLPDTNGESSRRLPDTNGDSSRRLLDTNGESSRRLPDTNGESSRRLPDTNGTRPRTESATQSPHDAYSQSVEGRGVDPLWSAGPRTRGEKDASTATQYSGRGKPNVRSIELRYDSCLLGQQGNGHCHDTL